MTKAHDFLLDGSGATAIEYALLTSLIAVAIITSLQFVGSKVSAVFSEVANALI